MTQTVRVLVQHCDALTHSGLVAAVKANKSLASISAPTEDSCDLRAFAEEERVDVLIADYVGAMEFVATRQRGMSFELPRVMIVTANDREAQIRNAMMAGVMGYLIVDCPLHEVTSAILTLAGGRCYLGQQVSQRVAESFMIDPLTAREQEVLRLLSGGLCNKDISRQLGISLGTTKSHMRSIFEKLKVESRTQALVTAVRHGILDGSAGEDTLAGPARASVGTSPAPRAPSRRLAEERV